MLKFDMESPPHTFWALCTCFLLLSSHVSIGLSSYPMCSPLTDNRTWVSQIYANGTAVQNCKDDCRPLAITYSALRRNGHLAACAECYCSQLPPDTDVEGCDYRCGDDECGGDSGKHSIYPVCPEGWYGYSCEFDCPANGHCADGVCHVEHGSCPAGCVAGYHGANCDQVCGECINGSCGRYDGVCDGGCRAGWYTPTCTDACPANCYLDACDIHNASCVNGCKSGWYNANCTNECSEYCEGDLLECHRDSGECNDGCISGWYTPWCTKPCPGHCNLTVCTLEDGHCVDGCKDGYHGVSCEHPCPAGCSEPECIQDSGFCYGCLNGTYGELCEEDCPANCAHTVCDMASGTCEHGCDPGWAGDICDTVVGSGGLSTPAIVGVCVMVAVVITGVVLFVLLFVRKRNEAPKSDSEGVTNPGLEETTADLGGQTGPKKTHPVPVMSESRQHTIDINHLSEYVEALTKSAHTLTKEYQNLPSEQLYDWEASRRESVKGKNQFKGIYPYDRNRVMLETVEDTHVTDYINASRIQGYNSEDRFIATLGPREKTMEDFWRMIWQEKASTVVMLTNLVESGVTKCDQYWPTDSEQIYGHLKLTLKTEDIWPSYIVRKFRICKNNNERHVTQFHYIRWPDHGVPSDATALLDFRRKLFRNSRPNTPVVVHCSAGVGRTGTLIAIDYLIKQAEAEGAVDVYNCVLNLRHQRIGMVQSVDQYKFIHEAVLEYLRVGTTAVSVAGFTAKYKEVIEAYPGSALANEYTILRELAPLLRSYDEGHSLSPSNRAKNRYPDILPPMLSRVYLRSRGKDQNDYINAVRVNAFKMKDAYHVTQFPLKHTTVDFWRMMQDYESNVLVILLTKEQCEETVYFLPAKNRPMDVLKGVASVRSSITNGSYRRIDIFLGDKTNVNQYMNIEDVSKDTNGRHVIVYEITIIPDQEYLDYDVISEVYRIIQQTKDTRPITVACLNGATYSGQFVACCNLFEMIESEQEIDVFQVSKYIRDSRPEFIRSLEQYRGLYEAVRTYLIQYGTYANC